MIISSSLSVRDHVDYILKVCNQRLYLLNKLKHAGLDEQGLATMFQAIVLSRVLYALPAWFGRLTQLDIGCINGLFRKAHRWQLSGHVYTVEQLAETADAGLFKAIASNPNHSLYQILPPFRPNQYSLRKRGDPLQLPIINTTLLKSTFINRCLFQFVLFLAPTSLSRRPGVDRPLSVALQMWCGR